MRAYVGKATRHKDILPQILKERLPPPRNDSRQLLTIRIHVLPFLRRYGFNSGGEQLMSRKINRPVFDYCARRVLAKKVVALPVLRWPDWPGNKTPAAIWADIAQNLIDTRHAERTFISTDTRLG